MCFDSPAPTALRKYSDDEGHAVTGRVALIIRMKEPFAYQCVGVGGWPGS